MITSIIILSVVGAASLIINGILWWYSKGCVQKIVLFHEGIEDLQQDLSAYSKHCYKLSRSEVYFKDPNIVDLYERTKNIDSRCQEFKESFTIVYDDDSDDEIEFEDGESDIEEEEYVDE